MNTPRLCECESFCTLSLELPLSEAVEIDESGLLFIVNGCAKGPSPGDILVQTLTHYSLYRE